MLTRTLAPSRPIRILRGAAWVCAAAALTAIAQTPRDFAIDLRAATSDTPPCLTLSWSLRQTAKISSQTLHRRVKNAVGLPWELQATLATNDTAYADDSAVPGVEYEYWLQRTFSGLSPSPAVGYLSAGVKVPETHARGTLLLVVDDTLAAPLAPEIAQLSADLAADGWTVQPLAAPRAGTPAAVKALIQSAYAADPAQVKMVYLLGHVPVPYSGNIAPDGHGDHIGAWPADGYYADMDGIWTDTTVNNTSASRPANDNVPGDGKFDQNHLPSATELMVGRVDLHSMTRAPSTAATELLLLRRYLRKAHDYRHKQGAYAAIPRRSLIRDGFGYFSGEAFAIGGWSWAFTAVGLAVDEAPSGQWFSAAYAGGKDYLVAYGNGGGSYESASSVGTTTDFGLRPSRAVFTSLFGSYFGDWDANNVLLRAPLAGNATGDSLGLTCFWGGRPNRFMHHLGMGETVGFATLVSHNSSFWSVRYQPGTYAGVHCGLMGDPALRLHAVEPPRHLRAASADSQITLAWNASSEPALQGYHVYRAPTPAGPFTRLTEDPLTATTYTDATVTAGQTYTYLARTLKLESAPGGSYYNLSVGSALTLTARAASSAVPSNPTALTVTPDSAAQATLTWTDTAANETGFRIERRTDAAGTFSLLATVAANTAAYLDPGPFTHGSAYAYRVIATNAAGDSAASPEASFDAIAGHFTLPATRLKVSKTTGNAMLNADRFGGMNGSCSVNYATADTSAQAGTHYSPTSGTLVWADGTAGSKTVTVPVVNTATPQPARQFTLTLSGNSAGTGLTASQKASILIEDPTATLGAPWSQTTVGGVTDSSPAVLIDGTLSSTVIGGSGVTSGTSDNGRFIYQSRSGDGSLTAYFPAGIPNDANARVCVMIRASTANNAVSASAVAGATSAFGTKLAYRVSAGGSATAIPANANGLYLGCWLRLTRAGPLFTAEASKDGAAWTVLGTATLSGMPGTALWGVFHLSSNNNDFHLASASAAAFADLPLPEVPTNLAANAPTPTAVTLTWTSVPGASGYVIERMTETEDFAQLADVAAATGASQTYTDTGLSADTALAYRVRAYNGSGSSGFCEPVTVTTPPPYLMLTVTTADTGGADATLQRDLSSIPLGTGAVVSTAGYFYDDGLSWSVLSNACKSYLRFDLTGLPTPISAQLAMTFADARLFEQYGYFDINAALLADSSDTWDEASITWDNAPQNATNSYGFTGTVRHLGNLYEERLPTAGEVVRAPLDAATLFANRGADNRVTLALYQYYGASTDWASRDHATLAPPALEFACVNPAPLRPAFLTATPGRLFSIHLDWTDVATNETGYVLERSAGGGEFAQIQMLPSGTTNFTDDTTQPDTAYAYRVCAVNAAGTSAWSSVATLATPGAFQAWGTVWDAGGLVSYFSWGLNWDLDQTPPFDGTTPLNFASSGTVAQVNTEARASGISLHSSESFTLLDGNGSLIVGADGIRAVNPNSETSIFYTIASDITLAADQAWGVTNNGAGLTTLVVTGPVQDSDAAFGFTKTGDGSLILAGDSTYDGVTRITDGSVRVQHDHAFGSTAGGTLVEGSAWLELSGGVTVPEPLTLSGGSPDGALRATDGTNTWSGPLTVSATPPLRALNEGSLTFAGGVAAPSGLTLAPDPGATLAVTGVPLTAGGSAKVTAQGGGTVVFGASSNLWGTLEIASTTVRTDATDVFPPGSIILMGRSDALDATLDLNGFDQTVAQLKRGTTAPGTRIVTSAAPATLTIDYSGSMAIYYDGVLNGAVSVTKTGSGTLTLLATGHDTSGDFTVSNGTLRFYNAFPVIADSARLSITSPGKLYLPAGLVETVGELVLDGGRKWQGTWGSSLSPADNKDDAHFAGAGMVLVPSGSSTAWDGGAPVPDINAPFNWDYDDLPALYDGSRTLAFGVGGHQAAVNTNVHFHGILLNRAADFTLAPGGGALTLGAGGLSAALPGDIPFTYTVAAPLVMAVPQLWCVTNAGAAQTTVIVTGTLSDGGAGFPLEKEGIGTLSLAGDNRAYGGEIIVRSNSVLRVAHAYGLGSTGTPTRIQAGGRLEVGGNAAVAEPVILEGDTSGPAGALCGVSGSNLWSGPITQSAPTRILAKEGGTLLFAAPSSPSYDLYLAPEAGACVALAERPQLLGSRKLCAHGAGTVAIAVTGNTWSTLEIGGAAVRLDVPGALPANSIVTMGTIDTLDATLDLNGNDQTVAQLKRGVTTPGTRTVTSATPAVLTVNQISSTYYCDASFSGALSLVKAGAGTLYLLGTNSTYTGATTVQAGTLRVYSTASLGKSARVTVSGGVLRLGNTDSISDDGDLILAGSGAKLYLEPGIMETVRTLRIGGTLMRRGTYSADAASGAQVIDPLRFDGTGVLRVLRGTESVITLR